MNILVTNDDGIDSPGLWALAEAMSRVGETMIVAPDKQQSGVGTSVSLHIGMNINEVPSSIKGVNAYAIGGTPNDCVLIGLRRLARQHIDLLVSGINLGANVGNDIPYSGTVMATLQGYFRKIPSIAMSLVLHNHEDELYLESAATVAESLALSVKEGKMPADAIINTNVPNMPLEEIKGMVTTRTAATGYVKLSTVKEGDSVSYNRGSKLLNSADSSHQTPAKKEPVFEEGTDIWAINQGLISITPLHISMTHHDLIPALSEHVAVLESDILGDNNR